MIDTIIAREKTMKGPADYKPEKKHKVKGHYNSAIPIGGFMCETEYLSTTTPASNYYKPDPDKLSKNKRSPNASLLRDGKGPRPICLPYKKDDKPNPFTYKDVDTKWEKLAKHSSPTRQVWNKEKSGSWLQKHQEAKKKIPGPGHNSPSIE